MSAAFLAASLALPASAFSPGGPIHARAADAAGHPAGGPFAAGVSPVPAQVPRQAPDSSSARSRARSLQRRFERHELRHLPRTLGSGTPECDEVIGRFCIWDEGESEWRPKAEAEEIVTARGRLLDDLEAVAREIPGDHWVFGQRIRYLFEAGRHAQAESLARRCALPERWRCDAYLGYVLHRREDVSGSEAAFRRALEAMPADMRAEWTDPDPVLDRGLHRWLSERADSAAALDRLWTLADPLFVAEGNDRWTAHQSRHVHAMSSEDARNPFGLRWGDDLAEIVVRYGWTTAWERTWPQGGLTLSFSVVGRGDSEAIETFPPRAVLERDPSGGEPVRWEIPDGHTQSAHLPPYLDSLTALEGQAGRFWRWDGVVVMGAWTAPESGVAGEAVGFPVPAAEPQTMSEGVGDPDVGAGRVRAGLFVEQDGVLRLDVRTEVDAGGAVRLAGHAPWADWGVVSMEAWAPETRRARRLRFGTGFRAMPPDAFGLSDLVLLAPGTRPESADDVVEVLRTSTVVEGDEALGVAFEVYGLRSRFEPVAFRAWVERRDEGLLSRVARWMRLGRREKVAVSWRESGPDRPGPLFRTFSIRLPELDAGAYDVAIEVSAPGRPALATRRGFTVR